MIRAIRTTTSRAALAGWYVAQRDPITDDVFVSWIDRGRRTERASPGSVLTALATRVDTDKESGRYG